MLEPPLLAYVGVGSQVIPPLAALATRTRDRARIGIAGWCLFLFSSDMLTRWWALHFGNTHLINYIADPMAMTWLLWVLVLWQVRPIAALTIRLLVPLALVANLILVAHVEDPAYFSLTVSTLNGLLVLSVVLFTLISRSLQERVLLTQFDWFWVGSGLVINQTAEMAIGPLARLATSVSLETLAALWTTKRVVNAIAMLIISRGLLCPTQPLLSGGSSSPPSSRPLSSW
ncbi:MAG TPA: hypothetical protein VMJ30_07880 [Gemmatimonadales bacterium]|nr:hypothetical protein [Gemmatimonadales bacterium]